MRKLLLLLLGLSLGCCFEVKAQQDPMFTKYMFNSLAYNPGFAGSPEYLSIRILQRNQWLRFSGAPTTQSFSIHMPFKERVGLGFSLLNDKVGSSSSTSAFFSYAYRIPFGKGKLSLGLQGGVMNWRADFDNLRYRDDRSLDEVFMENRAPNHWLPNFGAGIFYYTPKYYIGLSSPHLIDWRITDTDANTSTSRGAKYYRHYFFTAGAAFPLNGDALYFKPALFVKRVGLLGGLGAESKTLNVVGAPTEFDVDLSFLIHEVLWVGAAFRSAFEAQAFGGNSSFDSVDLWASFYFANGMRIGAAYDFTISELNLATQNSFEIMLGYDFNYETNQIATPRYF